MNLQDIMNQITSLGGEIRSASAKLAVDAINNTVSVDKLDRQRAALADMQKRMAGLQASYDALKGGQEKNL